MEYNHILDAKHLLCPIPILKAKKILKDMNQDEVLLVLTTDPSSVGDFKLFAKQTDCQLWQGVNRLSSSFVPESKRLGVGTAWHG